MWILLTSVLGASLLGSLHCIGMCGGFVAFYAGGDHSQGWQRSLSHLAYNGGRLLTYMSLGAVVGLAGAVVDFAGTAAGYQQITAILAGALMITWGGLTLLQYTGIHTKLFRWPVPFQRFLLEWQRSLREKPPVWRALILGLLSTLLPCGWLYAFAVTAAATANPWHGALVMGFFWLGTVPAMLSLGWSVHAISLRLRRIFPWISATMLIAIGISTIWHRSHKMVPIPSPATTGSPNIQESIQRVQQLPHKKPGCCGGKTTKPEVLPKQRPQP